MPIRISILSLALLLAAGPALALTPNDPLLGNQTHLGKVRAFDAWDMSTGSREVVVAVLDTGLDLNHPDIAGNLWYNPGEILNNGIDDDGNGFVDDVNGWDFIDEDNSPIPDRNQEFSYTAVTHGSAIAGVLGAVGNNGEGIAGINWKVSIMPLRILDNLGSGSSAEARKAVDYAIRNGADIINLSFTGFEVDTTFQDAIERAYFAGVVVVAAVGNQSGGGLNVNQKPIYPACFKTDGDADPVIGVAASTLNDTKADFSNYGSDCTDLSAPGEGIFTTMYHDPDWEDFEDAYLGGWNGTSIAAPMVSGAAALLRAQDPTLSPSQIQTILKLSADPMKETGISKGHLGAGRLNIARALEIAPQFEGELAVKQPSEPKEPSEPFEPPATGAPNPLITSSKRIVVAPAKGEPPRVRVFSREGALLTSFLAYAEGFAGGVRVALGDVDGDGKEEIVTAPGPGGGPHVRIFELDGTLRGQFFAFETDVRSGLYVAVGDIDGFGGEEIVVSTDAGGGGESRFFDMQGHLLTTVLPFDRTDLPVRVALGDVDGDGKAELVASLGPGLRPRVRVFEADGRFMHEFDAYASTYDRGVFVGTGDINGDGVDEIVTGTDEGGGPHVRAFTREGIVVASFFAYDERFRGGVRIGVGNLDGGAASIITAAGPGGGPHVRIFDFAGKAVGGFFSDAEADRNGINVGAWAF